MHIQVLYKDLQFPEGPAFAKDGNIWCVELKGESLLRYHDTGAEKFHVGGKPNGIAIDDLDKIWFCDAGNNAIRRFDPSDFICSTIIDQVDGETLSEPNDLIFDLNGNLIFTCPGDSRQNPAGYICAYSKGKTKKIITGKYFPNGLALTNDGKELVFAETYRHRLWKGDWNDETCELTNARIWCDIGGPDGPGGPDGMAFHPNGNLYVAVYGTQEIRIVSPNGAVIDKITLPGKNPTNCAFDFQNQMRLIVTEAERGELLSLFLS